MEAKHDVARIEEDVKSSDFTLMHKVMEYCDSPRFKTIIQNWTDQNVDAFLDWDDDSECTLASTDIFKEYVHLVETEIDKFLEQLGASTRDFYNQSKEITEGRQNILVLWKKQPSTSSCYLLFLQASLLPFLRKMKTFGLLNSCIVGQILRHSSGK